MDMDLFGAGGCVLLIFAGPAAAFSPMVGVMLVVIGVVGITTWLSDRIYRLEAQEKADG